MAEPWDPELLDHLSIGILQNNDVSPKKNDGTSPKNMNRSCFSHARKEHKDGGPRHLKHIRNSHTFLATINGHE
jgi:hypothetical protein